jgi:flagellin-specific chaperone FliS
MLARHPAAAYRRVDVDARIEAAGGSELTRICLEEVVASLGQALLALERNPGAAPREALARAHGIALWLGRSVDPANPLHEPLVQFYGGLASLIRRNMLRAVASEIAQARGDFADLLEAAERV